MRFASLGSGSRGNALVVQDCHAANGSCVLVDCGLGIGLVNRGLGRLGLSLGDIDAVFVTHEHGDHAKGVRALVKKAAGAGKPLPVYMTHGTALGGGFDDLPGLQLIDNFATVELGTLAIHPVAVPHDAREPCQYVVERRSAGTRLGILTDLGSFTPHVLEHYSECDAMVLECNHDVDMLQAGPYPPSVRRRVQGDWGHLSNEQAGSFLQKVNIDRLQWLVVAHVSQQNNTAELALDSVRASFGRQERIALADQDAGFDWLEIH